MNCSQCGCNVVEVCNVPGLPGADGAAGAAGVASFSPLSNLTFGAATTSATGTCSTNLWMNVGEYVFVSDGVSMWATMKITSFPAGTTQFVGTFVGNAGDATSGTIGGGLCSVVPTGAPPPNPVPVTGGGTNAWTSSQSKDKSGAAASGANSDITSLTGLTTPLSVPQGGSGAATLAGLLFGNGTSPFTGINFATGTFVANGASQVTVANAAVTANSVIICCLKTVGGTVGAVPAVKTITPTTGFNIAGTASDYQHLQLHYFELKLMWLNKEARQKAAPSRIENALSKSWLKTLQIWFMTR